MAIQRLLQSPLLNALYCEEEDQWEEEEGDNDEIYYRSSNLYPNVPSPFLFPVCLLQQDSLWEDDEELVSLLLRENKQQELKRSDLGNEYLRWEAVHWMVKANAHFKFSTLTAILAIDYLDRFLSSHQFDQSDKPWMIQIVAVTCLSLAAKVEETQVPLPVDLQVETQYVFDPKTIQKMELMVLSALKWKMNPVTPMSFLDYIITKLGLKTSLHWEFLSKCESLLLSVSSDSKFVHFLPSVLATATMCHVIDQMEPLNPMDHQNQLLGILNTSKEKVNECYELIVELSVTNICEQNITKNKRKLRVTPASPSGVVDVNFSSDCSNDSWDVLGLSSTSSSSVTVTREPLLKKNKVQQLQEQQQPAGGIKNNITCPDLR